MTEELDKMYGQCREPSKVDTWENGRSPLSLCEFVPEIGATLISLKACCQSPLLKFSSRGVTYLWAMAQDGSIKIAVEELAEMPDGTEVTGYPRRRNFPRHPSEEKKLGHPCLLAAKSARIAGELFLDEKSGVLCWYVNVSSGRYCRFVRPNEEQVANILAKFRQIVDPTLLLDDLKGCA